jgi:hypothetical protein
MIGINKGFMAMMPQAKPTDSEEYIINNKVSFTLFKKEFCFTIQVKPKPE